MKLLNSIKAHWFFTVCLLVPTGLFLYFSWYSEMAEGGPDNHWHYFISKYSYRYPHLFLDHWGKPIFILLSGPFAQFGFYGVMVFNILCGLSATVVSYRILQHFNIHFKWVIAPLIMFCPIYGGALQSALTEPLFSLILISAIYCFLKERYILGALILSLLMFSRSEGFFMTLYFVFFLAVQKKWKAIPFAFTAFLIYAIIGAIAGNGFWWYFTQNPYNLESPYGHGGWFDFFKLYNEIWGIPFLLALVFSTIVLLWIFFKQKQFVFWKPLTESGKVFYLLFAPFFIFTAFHVLVWRFGLCGSMGLDRVLTCVVPCYAIVTMWGLNTFFLSRFPKGISFALLAVFLYFHIWAMFNVFSYPRGAWGPDKAEIDAAKWFKTIMPKDYVIYYAHPAIVFNLDRDPFDRENNIEEFSFSKECHNAKKVPAYLFWDSQFSQSACGVSVGDVEKCGYKKLNEFHDLDFTLIVYEIKPE